MKKGFTLIEIIVVIAILGIMATAGITSFTASYEKARDSRRKSDLQTIRAALEIYKNDFNHYPICRPWCYSASGGTWITDSSSDARNLDSTYIKTMPDDPGTDSANPWVTNRVGYAYRTDATGSDYELVANLENDSDPDACSIKQYPRGLGATGTWCSASGFSPNNYAVYAP